MGLKNQGWLCRCDACGENADESIGGFTKEEMTSLARSRGFKSISRNHWFCSGTCLSEWIHYHEKSPAFSRLIVEAKKLASKWN